MLANGLSLYLTCTHTILIQLEKSFKPSFVWPKLHQAWISCWGKRKRTIMRYGNQQPTEWSEHMHKILYVYIGCRWLTKKIFTHIHKANRHTPKKNSFTFSLPLFFSFVVRAVETSTGNICAEIETIQCSFLHLFLFGWYALFSSSAQQWWYYSRKIVAIEWASLLFLVLSLSLSLLLFRITVNLNVLNNNYVAF